VTFRVRLPNQVFHLIGHAIDGSARPHAFFRVSRLLNWAFGSQSNGTSCDITLLCEEHHDGQEPDRSL